MVERNFLVRADGDWVRDRRGRLIWFSERGAHLWASRSRFRPQAYTVVRQSKPESKWLK